jgi:hypothetical protein
MGYSGKEGKEGGKEGRKEGLGEHIYKSYI